MWSLDYAVYTSQLNSWILSDHEKSIHLRYLPGLFRVKLKNCLAQAAVATKAEMDPLTISMADKSQLPAALFN